MRKRHSNVIIIGGGPAAHTAAIYTGRAFLQPLLFEGFMAAGIAAGGQLTLTTDVENYPGFPEGILGAELMEKMREQSIKCGATIITETVVKADISHRPFHLETEDGDVYTCDALIVATGAIAKRLHIPGGETYWQKGVSACAVCDGPAPIFRNKDVIVVGGGDSASEEANFLSKYAKKVHVLVRKPWLKASAIMAKRMEDNAKIDIHYNTAAKRLKGSDLLETVVVEDVKTGDERDMQAAGLFYAIGHVPNTAMFSGTLDMDEHGYILTQGKTTITNVSGVFACGDVQDGMYRQAITAAGSGCMAAMDAERFLAGDG